MAPNSSAPKALPRFALASYHPPGPTGTCPVTPSFLLGTRSLSFSDIKTKRLTQISHIGKLRDFLLEHRKDYINAHR
ncbi:Syntaxin-18 [Myotis davidii]|uniref:Syntaxin-18 n=1 Tax=Myotis davidii TaxID=225400 RepID=L5LPV2_MYODS|nr:Syntaxin-18 [Myotis davidii]